jgi:F-type H+-transporting ATPase subunit a
MRLSPDEIVFWEYGFVTINMTLVITWALMLVMVLGAVLITRNLKTDTTVSHWQSLLEMIVLAISSQIKEIGLDEPRVYLPYLATLFLFIAISNSCIIFPYYEPPTGSLSTTSALAVSVFVAVPVFGIMKGGVVAYLKSYAQPSIIMLPFNIIGEFTRTLALAVRLFGNIMSGAMIVAILLSISPFIFPVLMNTLGLLTGLVQAYIFSVLAAVFIAAAVHESESTRNSEIETNVKKED